MFYVIPYATEITACGDGTPHPQPVPFADLGEAQAYAARLHGLYQSHWRIVEVQPVWTTKTMADIRREDRAMLLNRNIA